MARRRECAVWVNHPAQAEASLGTVEVLEAPVLQDGLCHILDDVRFVLEMPVQGRGLNAELGCDLTQCDAFQSLLVQYLKACPHNRLRLYAGALRVRSFPHHKHMDGKVYKLNIDKVI